MSARIDRAIEAAGLSALVGRRLQGDVANALVEAATSLDLLVLGAIADRARRADRGDVVRIHLTRPHDEVRVFDRFDPRDGGHAFVRAVALARLGARGPLRVDLAVGAQLAQVALVFGADELVAVERTLPIAGDAAVVRERELAAIVRSARRTPRIVVDGTERDVDETRDAKRLFRAPGRDKPASPNVHEGEP